MKLKKFMHRAVVTAASVLIAASAAISADASAEWRVDGIMGDLNYDMKVNIADLVLLSKHVMHIQYLTKSSMLYIEDAYYTVGNMYGEDFTELPVYNAKENIIQLADMNQDGLVNSADLSLMRKSILSITNLNAVYRWYDDEEPNEFISPPIYDLYGTMPSQGNAGLAVFYVDFPDSRFNYDASVEEIEQAVFGKENANDTNFPFDSISAFYNRASKGAINLYGSAYKYTAQHEKSYYENDVYRGKIASEVIKAFNSQINFNDFDGDGDKVVDAVLICVPNSEGTGEWNSDWWPAAGAYGGEYEKFDGCTIGHVIVGNSVIESPTDHSYFVSTYSHELGHCMGLPDFYFYTDDDDWQGLHGSAGFTMMDDANCDFCAASKLMLGWYRSQQIQVYDSSAGTQSFILEDAQSENGNCIIIPCGEMNDNYFSEFFIIEYMTSHNNNNSSLKDWLYWYGATGNYGGNGIRIFHVDASVTDNGWWKYFTYESGEDKNTNYNKGKRFIRIINDSDEDNLYHENDVIDSSISGFNWYDSNGNQTIDPNITITVGRIKGDKCSITISGK